ncbi:hypothetical protein [Microbacterium flavescens]|uniref:hypothetical protein n=1 Tax=Microbacterium flavescens TaxID=69366 RepID=UPI001BDEE44A|nr:hypothetical protein [Microbacterium flavescens]
MLGIDVDLEVRRVEVDLFEALAREVLTVVRLVKLRSAAPSREMDALQDAIAERVREYVRKSMPMPNPGTTVLDQTAELKHATLICAPTEFQLQQRVDWASSEFGVVVVASPEDRSSPWSGDAFVRDDDRFVGFTLLHVVSVAGLWRGLPTGSFELVRREESGHRSVWLSRVFINAVLAGALSRRAAAQVLTEAARSDSALVDPGFSAPPVGTVFIQDGQVSGYIDEMVQGAMSLDGGALEFNEPAVTAEPARDRSNAGTESVRFVSFSADKLARVPVWTWRWLTSAAYRRVTKALHSDEGSTELVGYESHVFDTRELELIADAERIVMDEQRARAEAGAPASVSHIKSTPRLWARLRELVFGSLDGSADLSDLGFAPIEDAVPIFGRVSDVLALPEHPWLPPRSLVPHDFPERVDWYVLALEDPRERLVDAAADASAARDAAQREVTTLQQDVERLKAELSTPIASPVEAPPSATPAAAGTESGPAAPPPPPAPPAGDAPETLALKTSIARVETKLGEATAEFARFSIEAERFEGGVNAFDEWASTQDRTFVWRLLTRLGGERRAAEQKSAEFSEQIDSLTIPEPGELIRLRSRFHRVVVPTWLIGAVVAGLSVYELVRRAIRGDDIASEIELWTILGATVGVVVIISVIALIAYHRGWSRFQRRINLERHRLAQLGTNSRTARQEASRLASLHRQTVDWLVLLSRAIHRPWHVPEQWTAKDDLEVARSRMPFAVQVATVVDDDHASATRLRGVMTEHLFVRGWRHDAFTSLVREIAIDRGMLSSSFGPHTLDEDLPHASNHSRRMLLAAIDDEHVLTRVAGPRLEELMKAAHRDEGQVTRPRVQPVVDDPLHVIARGPNGEPIATDRAWDDFLLGSLAGRTDPMTPLSATVLTEIELGERHHERVQSHLVLPERLAAKLAYSKDTPVQVVSFPDDSTGVVDLSWRVDIAGPVPIRAIHLWDRTSRPRNPESSAVPTTNTSGDAEEIDTGI